MTGTSYNYYDSADSSWNQIWIDNKGRILKLKGKFIKNKMVLKRGKVKGKKIDWPYNRISWNKNENGSITQSWDVVDEKDNILATVFKGIYKRN